MKQLKKIMNLMIVFVGVLVTTLTISAASQAVINITNNPAQTGVSMEGHTYSAYKVFDLELTDADPVGYLYTISEDFVEFFKMKNGGSEEELNTVAIEYLETNNIATVAKELREYVITNNIAATATSPKVLKGEESTRITVDQLGYYLVLDNGNGTSNNAGSVISAAALGTTDTELNISLKASGPTIDKEIYQNDTESWGPVGDNQIGDKVEYRIITTIPDPTGYTNYSYQLNDSMTDGLTFNNDIEVYVGSKTNGGVRLSDAYYTMTNVSNRTFSLNVDIMQGIANQVFAPQDQLYVYYSATLNENAIVADGSNDNTVELEYSNNPYDESSKDTTPEITVRDYTFKINVLKTKEDGQSPLAAAEFEIHESDGTPLTFTQSTKEDGTMVYVVSNANEASKTLISPANGKFEIIGLDDATKYTMYETKAPEGYNAMKPIDFTINAAYDANGQIQQVTVTSNGTIVVGGFELGTTIVNTSGFKLPDTGGAGTTLFTVVGLGLVVVAVIVLVRRNQTRKYN